MLLKKLTLKNVLSFKDSIVDLGQLNVLIGPNAVASESMQLIVTTHSDALIDALPDRPEAVLMCERDFQNGTQSRRLSEAI